MKFILSILILLLFYYVKSDESVCMDHNPECLRYEDGSSNLVKDIVYYDEFIKIVFCGKNHGKYYLKYSDNMTYILTVDIMTHNVTRKETYNFNGKLEFVSHILGIANITVDPIKPDESVTNRFIHRGSTLSILLRDKIKNIGLNTMTHYDTYYDFVFEDEKDIISANSWKIKHFKCEIRKYFTIINK